MNVRASGRFLASDKFLAAYGLDYDVGYEFKINDYGV